MVKHAKKTTRHKAAKPAKAGRKKAGKNKALKKSTKRQSNTDARKSVRSTKSRRTKNRSEPPHVGLISADSMYLPPKVAENVSTIFAPSIALSAEPSPLRPHLIGISLLVFALLFWVRAIPFINQADLSDFGIVSTLPYTYWISLALLTCGFGYSIQNQHIGSPVKFTYLIILVLLLHGTPSYVYESMRYPWAWKHLGIVDYIQRHHAVDLTAPFLSVYHNWPGLFIVTAVVADTLHLKSVEIADWVKYTPPLLTFLYAVTLIPLYRRMTNDNRVVYAAIWFFVTGNWVGQEYFSPQGFCFLLFLIVIAICIGPLRNVTPADPRSGSFVATIQERFAALLIRAPEFSRGIATQLQSSVYNVIVFLLVMAITATHQLTPIALIFTLAALAAVGRISIWYCIFAIFAEMAWLLYFAAPFVEIKLADQLRTFGEGISAASQNLVTISNMNRGQQWVVIIGRSIAFAIGLFAIIGVMRRLSLGFRDGVAIALLLSAFPLFLTRYEGEILFRVYLFASPFLAFFVAMAFFPNLPKGATWITTFTFGISAYLAATAFLFANNGKDLQYAFAKDEVETVNWLFVNAPPHSLLVDVARNYPTQFVNYENFDYVTISEESAAQQQRILDDPALVLEGWLSDTKWNASYVIITKSQKAFVDAQHVMRPGSLEKIEAALLESPKFVLIKASENAKVFSLVR